MKKVYGIEIGQRVQVVKPGHYKTRAIGRAGVVKTIWSSESIGVLLDDTENTGSKYGYFYFKICELEVIAEGTPPIDNKEENNMKPQPKENYVNVAMIQYQRGRYSYEAANYDPDLQIGDVVVVMSASHGMDLATVQDLRVDSANPAELVREVIAKVDTTDYDARVETRKQAADLHAKMKERAKKLQDIALFQTLAQNDPEMAELLKSFQNLPKY